VKQWGESTDPRSKQNEGQSNCKKSASEEARGGEHRTPEQECKVKRVQREGARVE